MAQRVRRAASVALALGLFMGAAACSDQDDPDPEPMTQSSGPAPSPSVKAPTSTPEPSAKPLSRFEDEAPVIAAREWAGLLARAINREEPTMKTAAPLMTDAGRSRYPEYASTDYGKYYPGPQPFTPTGVEVNGQKARISTCWWSLGFALDRQGGVPADKRQIDRVDLTLVREDGQWKVDDGVSLEGSCEGVPVKGVGW